MKVQERKRPVRSIQRETSEVSFLPLSERALTTIGVATGCYDVLLQDHQTPSISPVSSSARRHGFALTVRQGHIRRFERNTSADSTDRSGLEALSRRNFAVMPQEAGLFC